MVFWELICAVCDQSVATHRSRAGAEHLYCISNIFETCVFVVFSPHHGRQGDRSPPPPICSSLCISPAPASHSSSRTIVSALAEQEYLDFVAGISTCALGHADPDLAAAVGDQMKKFHHVSNLYYIPEQVPPPHALYPVPNSLQCASAAVVYYCCRKNNTFVFVQYTTCFFL